MPQRRSSLRRGRPLRLACPALLLCFLQTACGGGRPADPVAALAVEFPEHAATVLGAGRGFVPGPAGIAGSSGDRLAVRADLPWDGAGEIVFHGPAGFEARVREVGAAGEARLVEQAVSYRRPGGSSFWTTAPGGIEEWLHLAPGAGGDGPVAAWHVEGARIRERGEAIELVGPDGATRARVTAPAAFAPGGRHVDAHLKVASGGQDIELYADAGGEALLVDPLWKVVASMSYVRADHAAALTGTGKVLATGGTDGNTTSLSTAELYDPVADAWTDVSPMVWSHVCHTETALTDGTVLVAGGLDDFGSPENRSEVFAETTLFTDTQSDMFYARMNHAGSILQDGRVLLTGGIGYFALAAKKKGPSSKGVGFTSCWGYGGGGSGSGGSGSGGAGALSSAEVYDPGSSSWSQVAQMQYSRERHTETLLPNGHVVVTGGLNYGYAWSSFEIWDPATDSWNVPDANMATQRADHTATLLADGTVLLAGGSSSGNNPPTDSAEILDLNSGGTLTSTPMTTPRAHHTATLLPDGTVLVAGGTDGKSSLASAEIYDPVAGTWTATATMTSARSDHAATPLPNGDVLVMGGIDDSGAVIAAAERFVHLKPNGIICGVGGECQSTFCTTGVCCDASCGESTCQTCSVAKGATADGVCTNLDNRPCDSSLCSVSGLCSAGTCVGAIPKPCPAPDACHVQGTCDPGSGACSSVAKLDGSPCPTGICIAGTCVPDPSVSSSSSSSSSSSGTTTTGTTTTASSSTTSATPDAGGSGGAPPEGADELTGNGCAVDPARSPTGAAPAGLLFAMLAALKKRRRK